MSEEVLERTNKNDGFIKGAMNAAAEVAKTSVRVERLKEKASHAIEDGITDAKRMAKRGMYAAEDLVEDTAHRIKKEPWKSVGLTLGIGMGLGVMIGWLACRQTGISGKYRKMTDAQRAKWKEMKESLNDEA